LTSADNTHRADCNELIFLKAVNQNVWSNSLVQDTHDAKRALISESDYQDQLGRALTAANAFFQYVGNPPGSAVSAVWWSARPGVFKEMGISVEKTFPADVVVQWANGSYLGVSLKSSDTSLKLCFRNNGLGTLNRILGRSFSKPYTDGEQELLLRYPHLSDMTDKVRKRTIRSDKSLEAEVKVLAEKSLTETRNILYSHYCEIGEDSLRNHLIENWLSSGSEVPYLKITAKGIDGDYQAIVEDPSIAVKNIEVGSITVHKVHTHGIGFLKDEEDKFMKIRVKTASQPFASAIKVQGEYWG
jgi:hypothetical protein